MLAKKNEKIRDTTTIGPQTLFLGTYRLSPGGFASCLGITLMSFLAVLPPVFGVIRGPNMGERPCRRGVYMGGRRCHRGVNIGGRPKDTCVQTYIHTHIHTYMHSSMHTYKYNYISTHTCMHTHLDTCPHTYMFRYIHK